MDPKDLACNKVHEYLQRFLLFQLKKCNGLFQTEAANSKQ